MKYLASFLLLALVACNASKKNAETSSGNINATAPYKWTSSFPKTLNVSQQFTADEVTALGLMTTAWSASVSNQKTFFSAGSVTTEKTNSLTDLNTLLDNEMAVYKCANWPAGLPASALAVTQIFGRRFNVGKSDEFVSIEHADIIVNDDFYDFDTANTGPGFDFRTVVLHEMGHFLGLQHKSTSSDRNLSIMYPSIDPTEAKRAPKIQDINDISSKYEISSGAANPASVGGPRYEIRSGDTGSAVKIIIELHADGTCVHKENGLIVKLH